MSAPGRRRTVLLGAFVSVAAAVLGATILGIGDLRDTFTKKQTATAVFRDVGGLRSGDNVWYAGVKVGVVQRLELEGADAVRVSLSIDREAAEHVPFDVLARIGSDGLIGNRIVILAGGTPGGPAASEGAEFRVESTLSTDDVLTTLQRNNLNVLAITADVKELTARLAAGEGTLGKLVGQDGLYADLAKTAADARATASDVRAFSVGLTRPDRLPDQLLEDDTLYPSLVAGAADLEEAARRISLVSTDLQRDLGQSGTPVGVLLHDRAAAVDLQALLDNLRVGSERLSDDLEAAQHNILLRGFFRKRARREAAAERRSDEARATEP